MSKVLFYDDNIDMIKSVKEHFTSIKCINVPVSPYFDELLEIDVLYGKLISKKKALDLLEKKNGIIDKKYVKKTGISKNKKSKYNPSKDNNIAVDIKNFEESTKGDNDKFFKLVKIFLNLQNEIYILEHEIDNVRSLYAKSFQKKNSYANTLVNLSENGFTGCKKRSKKKVYNSLYEYFPASKGMNVDEILSLVKRDTAIHTIFFDWDRTITTVEGLMSPCYKLKDIEVDSWYLLKEHTHDKDLTPIKAIDFIEYLLGGKARYKLIKKLFEYLRQVGINVYILTNNTLLDRYRDFFHKIVKLIDPDIQPKNLIYSGRSIDPKTNTRSKGIALKQFLNLDIKGKIDNTTLIQKLDEIAHKDHIYKSRLKSKVSKKASQSKFYKKAYQSKVSKKAYQSKVSKKE